MNVLITGISSHIGKMVAKLLVRDGCKVSGIDRRPWPDAPRSVKIYDTDIRKRLAEDVFRTVKPEGVIHLATVSYLNARAEERHRINLGGTRAVYKYSDQYGVKHTVFVGRHTYYGANHDAPLYHTEDDPPMSVATFPQLADLIAADLFAGASIWRYPRMTTAVLRLCYLLGPSRKGTLSNYIEGKRVPTVLGFDPLFQFMHEEDAARAVCLALQAKAQGVFNVSGPQPIPLSILLKHTRRQNIPLPEPLFLPLVGRLGFPRLPSGALNHIKYPVIVERKAFVEATGFHHLFDEIQTMESFLWP